MDIFTQDGAIIIKFLFSKVLPAECVVMHKQEYTTLFICPSTVCRLFFEKFEKVDLNN